MALNFVTFNQDCSLIAVGTSSGFRVFYADPFSKREETHEGNISLLEMLFSTSLIAQVLSPRRLVITNTKRNSTICELTFPTTILALRLNRKRLVVVLEDQIYIYDLSNMKLVHTIDTSPNTYGICALSPSSDRCYLAYPLPQKAPSSSFSAPAHVPPTSPHTAVTSGHVLLFDAITMQAVNVIEAHRTPLSCLTMNSNGTRLATASEKGTIIRVFSVPDAQKLFQFRRGSIPSRISSMSFNMTSTLLCVSSASETIHVFRLSPSNEAAKGPPSPDSKLRRSSFRSDSPASDERPDTTNLAESSELGMAERKHNGTFAGMVRRTSQTVGKSFAATIGGYLPTAVSEMLEPTRDFAWFKVPRQGSYSSGSVRTVVAMSSNSPEVMVVTSEGSFLVFNIDLEKGGEGTLTKQYSVLDSGEKPRTSIGE